MGMRSTSPGGGWWAVVLGAVLGLGGGVALGRRRRMADRRAPRAGELESALVRALLEDPDLSQRPIEVCAIADGIVELTGLVATEEEADRAVDIARRVAGVRTVLNRLDSDALESHLAETRRRFGSGDPALAETRWYGQGVGTGRRRQGRDTDPGRRDDRVDTVSRELGTDRAVELASDRLDKVPPGVTGHSTGVAAPLDRGRVDQASHRRLGNVPERGPQEVNPDARVHHEVKKAERIRLAELEHGGLEPSD